MSKRIFLIFWRQNNINFSNFRSYKDNQNLSNLLKIKYENALDIYDIMLRALPQRRPNCEEILKRKNLWALNEEEFEINDNLSEQYISEINDKNQLIISILKSKLKI
jgi:hypothetical protein